MKILYTIGVIASFINCLISIHAHNISAAFGWASACLWLVFLITKEKKDD